MLPLLLQTDALELADIREPINIISWVTILLISLVVIAVIGGAYFLWLRRKQKLDTEEEILIQISPIEKAREAFKSLRKKQTGLGDKAYISAVSGVIRDYLEDAYQLPAPERTTEEFFDLLRAENVFEPEMQTRLMDFLQQSDLIKFARQGLNASQREPLLTGAEDFVETAENKRSEVTKPANSMEVKAG